MVYGIGIVVMLVCLGISLAACNLPSFGRQPSAKKPTPTSTTDGVSTIGPDATPISTIGHDPTLTSTIGHDPTLTSTIGPDATLTSTIGHVSILTSTTGHNSTPIATIGHNSTPIATIGPDATLTSTTGHDATLTSTIDPDSTPISATVSSSAKSCGTLRYQQAGTNRGLVLAESNNSTQKVANCFLQAFKQCVPASIEMNVSIVAASINPSSVGNMHLFSTKLPEDGGAANLYQFTINSQSGSCVVSEVEQAYSVVAPTPPTPQTCAQVEQTRTDLRFVSCGNSGTITFPLA